MVSKHTWQYLVLGSQAKATLGLLTGVELASMEGFQENLSCRNKNDHVSVTTDHQTHKVPGKEPGLGYEY